MSKKDEIIMMTLSFLVEGDSEFLEETLIFENFFL